MGKQIRPLLGRKQQIMLEKVLNYVSDNVNQKALIISTDVDGEQRLRFCNGSELIFVNPLMVNSYDKCFREYLEELSHPSPDKD